MEALWGFWISDLPNDHTRLVISGYQTFRPRWVERLVAPWRFISVSWPMQARMMAVLKRNIERTHSDKAFSTTQQGSPRT